MQRPHGVAMNYFHQVYERIREATNARTQVELAAVLGIKQSSISDAKRRGSIPADWFLTLFEERGINPDWLKKGVGPVFLRTCGGYTTETATQDKETAYRQVPLYETVDGVADCSQLPIVDTLSLPHHLLTSDMVVVRINTHDIPLVVCKNAIVGIDTAQHALPKVQDASQYLFALRSNSLGLRIHVVHSSNELDELMHPKSPQGSDVVPEMFGRVAWVLNIY